MIKTLRLLLCRPKNEDLPIIENLWRDEKVRQFLGGTLPDDLIKTKIDALLNHWELHQFGLCVVFDSASKNILGLCGLHHAEDGIELSYMFFPGFWKKGFAHEAATACIEYGLKTLKLEKIIAITQAANVKSCQLLEKIGMKHIKNFERFNESQCLFSINAKQNIISIKRFKEDDIPLIVKAFKEAHWEKPDSTFETYLHEQAAQARLVWLAYLDEQFAGYVTLKWQSQYKPFTTTGIPEIMDLNVLPYARKMGVGALLLNTAEQKAATKSTMVGIGVGLYAGADGGYGSAQRLYVKHGYIPDGKGLTYDYKPSVPGNSYPLDDDLILWFTKKLH